jgi:hypothetical protein
MVFQAEDPGVHACGIAGGHSNHWSFGGSVAASGASGAGSGPPYVVFEQLEAADFGLS